jgi:hypothetical protein
MIQALKIFTSSLRLFKDYEGAIRYSRGSRAYNPRRVTLSFVVVHGVTCWVSRQWSGCEVVDDPQHMTTKVANGALLQTLSPT